MGVKKLKPLDITRLVISIIALSAASLTCGAIMVVMLITAFFTFSGYLAVMGIVIPIICLMLLEPPGVLGFIRFFVTRKKDISKRGFSALGLSVVISYFLVSTLFKWWGLLILAVGVAYLICDIIEIKICKKELLIQNENQEDIRTQTKHCGNCGTIVNPEWKYCGNCGSLINVEGKCCVNCGSLINPEGKYCGNCGSLINAEGKCCVNCGSLINPEGKYCGNCGKEIK